MTARTDKITSGGKEYSILPKVSRVGSSTCRGTNLLGGRGGEQFHFRKTKLLKSLF